MEWTAHLFVNAVRPYRLGGATWNLGFLARRDGTEEMIEEQLVSKGRFL
jgi:hypothetical protein